MSKGKIWLLCDSFLGLWFGVSMYQVVDQSRPFRREALSSTSTLKVIGIGAASGLIFIVLGWLLGKLYEKARPTAGEFSALSTLVRVMVGAVIGGIIGATIFTPLMGVMGDLAVVFIDYHGVLLYFTGAVGGCAGAVWAALNSTKGLRWWIRLLTALGAVIGGAAVGFMLGWSFIALYAAPFARPVGV